MSNDTPLPEIIHGDCIVHMAAMAAAGKTYSSIVTDPPYHLTSKPGGKAGFMGRAWDGGGIAFDPQTWRLALDLLEPGGMLAAFGGSRTQHRMACAIEDAGFEIRDAALWLYGSGFPKSKALLKPAYEPIILARKPGPLRMLDIDGCRVPATDKEAGSGKQPFSRNGQRDDSGRPAMNARPGGRAAFDTTQGRWPANILHDGSEEVLEAFAAFGSKRSAWDYPTASSTENIIYGKRTGRQGRLYDDAGSAARFFYAAKASKHDRAGSRHPTIKPLSLMRYLCRLINLPGGTILDPFAGSGTTLAAAHMEGFHAVGIEREAEYVADVRRRIAALTATAQPAPLGGLFAEQDAAE